MSNSCTQRRRRFQQPITVLLLLQSLYSSNSFTPRINVLRVTSTTINHSLPSIHVTKLQGRPQHYTDDNINTFPTTQSNRLTLGQEKHLLRRAIEYRRIKEIKSKLVLKTPRLTDPPLLKWAAACNYTTDVPGIEAFEDALSIGQNARDELITAHVPLVHAQVWKIVKSKKLRSLSREDLFQEGCIGLARAVDRFSVEKNVRFGTYATYWIRASVLRCVAERDELVRVPQHVTTALGQVRGAASRLGLDFDGFVSGWDRNSAWREADEAKRLAVESGLTQRQVSEAVRVGAGRRKGVVEFESWMVGVEEASGNGGGDLREALEPFLNEKEMEALSLRYGLDQKKVESKSEKENGQVKDYLAEAEEELFGANGIINQPKVKKFSSTPATSLIQPGRWGEAMTFKEIGRQMTISAEYGRRLCGGALDKLRLAAEDGRLDPGILC